MKNIIKILSILLTICFILSVVACGSEQGDDKGNNNETVIKDFSSEVKLDMSSNTLKQEVTVHQFVDGDTTHFNVPTSVVDTGVLKARYLAVNTPESTGKIEEYGKAASNYTKSVLSKATSIIIESDDGKWNADSTGGRFLVWVWYKTADSEEYKNLNIDLLQKGLAIASNSGNNIYGSTCLEAIAQAKSQKLNVYSGEKDPDFFYGSAIEIDLKELRTNVKSYLNMKVAFEGVVTFNDNNSVYVENYDAETDMYYGFSVYYGFSLNGDALEILNVGNKVRIVGSVQYYEAGNTYQISGLTYRAIKPNDPGNIQKISDGHTPAFVLTTADQFLNGIVSIDTEEGSKEYKYAELALNTSICMENLKVQSIYTTDNPESSSNGAMTMTCTVDGKTISVRTTVLKGDDGKIVTADMFEGKTIDVKGIVDFYNGGYQIKVLSTNLIQVSD